MKLYLAGPMRGIADYNFPAFHAATTRLRAAGRRVVELERDWHGRIMGAVKSRDRQD